MVKPPNVSVPHPLSRCCLRAATAMQLVPTYEGGSNSQRKMAGGQGGADHDPVVQLSITLAVANVYGTAEDDMQEAHAFLSEQHIAEQVRGPVPSVMFPFIFIPLERTVH